MKHEKIRKEQNIQQHKKSKDSKVRQHKNESFFGGAGGGSFFSSAPVVQGKDLSPEEPKQLKADTAPAQEQSSTSSGSALPEATKAKMESSFGTDLSHIKVHTNSESAANVGALAYAQGNDLHFAKGQFNPGTEKGDGIIGHEVAHTFQQQAGKVKPTTEVNGMAVNDSPSLEHEADVMGAKAAKGEPISMKADYTSGGSASGGTSQRKQAIQRLTLFAHGFLPKRDFLGNKKRRKQGEVVHENDYNGFWKGIDTMFEERLQGRDVKDEAQQGAQEEAEVDTQSDQLHSESFAKGLGEGNVRYFDGSSFPLSKAKKRMKYGKEAAKRVHEQVLCGQITLQKNDKGEVIEPIILVGQSMGAAYVAGMATQLLEFNRQAGKTLYPVKAVYYLAPHQPKDIVHPPGVRGVQYSHKRDAISSKGLLPFLTGSKLGRIQNISEYTVFEKKVKNPKTGEEELLNRKVWDGRGGHRVEDHDYIFSEYGPDDDGYVEPTMYEAAKAAQEGGGAEPAAVGGGEQKKKRKGLFGGRLRRKRKRR